MNAIVEWISKAVSVIQLAIYVFAVIKWIKGKNTEAIVSHQNKRRDNLIIILSIVFGVISPAFLIFWISDTSGFWFWFWLIISITLIISTMLTWWLVFKVSSLLKNIKTPD